MHLVAKIGTHEKFWYVTVLNKISQGWTRVSKGVKIILESVYIIFRVVLICTVSNKNIFGSKIYHFQETVTFGRKTDSELFTTLF